MNTDQGYIKLHRKILESPVYTAQDPYLFQLWIYVLLKVCYKDQKFLLNGEEVVLQAGQGVFGLNQTVRDLTKIKKEKSKIFLKMKTIYYRRYKILQKMKNLKLNPTNKYTIVTVINWERYQSNETQVKLNCNSTETQLKTYKKDKKDKNIYVDFLQIFNETTNRRFKILSVKAKRQIDALLKEGYGKDDWRNAVKNAMKNKYLMGENDNRKVYLTPEYISRSDKFEDYLQGAIKPNKQNDISQFFT